jgi:hypothetical protein
MEHSVETGFNAHSGDAVILFAFSVVLTILSVVDPCGPPLIWWGSLSMRLLAPLVTAAVPPVCDAGVGRWPFIAVGLAVVSSGVDSFDRRSAGARVGELVQRLRGGAVAVLDDVT